MKNNLLFAITLWVLPVLANSASVVEPAAQKSRDMVRVKILQTELDKEQTLYSETRASLSNAIVNKESDKKITDMKNTLQQHQRNIEAIKQELASIKGMPTTISKTVEPIQLTTKNLKQENNYTAPSWDVYARSKTRNSITK